VQDQLADYVNAFTHLRTDSGKAKFPEITLDKAPHKPLLLLTVLDLAAQGSLRTNFVSLSPELGDLFTLYWKLVMPSDRAGNLALPFFHLKNDGFWHLIPHHDKEEILAAIRQIAGMAQLRDTVIGVQLDEALYQLICIEETRNILRAAIIKQYFRSEIHDRLLEQAIVNVNSFQYSEELLEKARNQPTASVPIVDQKQKPAARDQGFRRAIVTAYDHRCVLCGVRILTLDGHTAATAAHIIPWSISYNDNPRSGLCLCRLCHWVFDEGLVSITPKYRVRLSQQIYSIGNISGHISTLNDRPIFEPTEPVFNPDVESLAWHNEHTFLP
jgi:putative restriction endonuclease